MSSEALLGGGVAESLRAAGDLEHNEAGKPNFVYEFNPEVADKWFNLGEIPRELSGGARVRLGRMGVHGDGSCAYHTLCVALNHDDYVHQTDERQKQIAYQFRCSFGDTLTPDKWKNIVRKSKAKATDIDNLQEALCDPKVWADETALRIVAEALDINLVFLDLEKNQVYCGMHHEDAVANPRIMPRTIVILWVSHSHFEPLVHIESVGPRVARVRAMLEPSKSELDARLVQALMSRYKTQCKIRK